VVVENLAGVEVIDVPSAVPPIIHARNPREHLPTELIQDSEVSLQRVVA